MNSKSFSIIVTSSLLLVFLATASGVEAGARSPVSLAAPVEAGEAVAHPPQGLSAEEWAGILRQIGRAEAPLSAAILTPNQVKKLTAGDGAAGDASGISVAVSGDTIVVGADICVLGTHNGGAAYVFTRNWGGAENWGQVKKLIASDGAGGDGFGNSVAVSGDTLVVGTPDADIGGQKNAGAAYLFTRNQGGTDNWGQVKKLTASDGAAYDNFGDSVTISSDTIVVGAPWYENTLGAAYLFTRNQGGVDNWGQVKKLTPNVSALYDYFGRSAAVSGDIVVVGMGPWHMAAHIFSRNQGGADNWGQVKKLTHLDGVGWSCFGRSVVVSGDAVVVGAHGNDGDRGAAYVYQEATSHDVYLPAVLKSR